MSFEYRFELPHCELDRPICRCDFCNEKLYLYEDIRNCEDYEICWECYQEELKREEEEDG